MSRLLLTLGVAGGGSAGAVTRFLVDGWLDARSRGFPLGILLINVTGSLLLGILGGLVLFHDAATAWQVVLGTGYCGGFTTFSTTSFASVRLAQGGSPVLAAVNVLGTLLLTVSAATAGLLLAAL